MIGTGIWEAFLRSGGKYIVARKTVLVVIALVGPLLSIYFLFGGQSQPVQAQGLDLDRHCRQHGKERVVNIDGTAYGWRCEDLQGQAHHISVQDACNEQYGSGYMAAYHSMDDPNSWYCAAPSPQPQQPSPPNPPVAAPAAPVVQQSQPESQSAAAPAQPAWTVTDGCTNHPDQVYTGESSPPGGDYLRVNVSGLRVRMGPGTNHCINGYAVQGRYYPVHNVKGSWALITGTYGAGWLHTSYVTLYGGPAPRNPVPEPRNPLDQIDLGPGCTAVGSAQLNGPSAVAGCVSSALDERLTQQDIWNVSQVLWDCGAVQTYNFSIFLALLQSGFDPASAALEAFDAQSTSDCANDLIELFGG